MAKLFDKIRAFLGRKKPVPKITVTGGHRGIAAGDLAERHRRIAEGEEPYNQEEIDKWQNVPADEAEDFIYGGQILHVNSSNLTAAQYHPETQQMMIEYHDGAYLYSNVTPQEALQFVQAQSKGGFIWSVFRVRGSKTAHKKPFVRLR